MTTTTTPTPARSAAAPTTPARTAGSAVDAHLRFGGVLRGERIKLLSLRSTWWTLGITVVLMGLLALAQAASAEFIVEGSGDLSLHGAEFVTGGYQLGMVTVAVLGVLLVTGEYSTGMIRSTLAAVPSRLPVLAAKAVALSVVIVIVSAVSLAVSYVVTMPFLSDYDLVPSLGDSGTWQLFGGMAFFFVAVALFALGIGTLLRHTAGAITVVLAVLLLLPMILQFINLDWVQDVLGYMPLPAAMSFLTISGAFGGNEALTAWQGVAVVSAYAVAALAAGAISLRRRDA
ncbi:ABC transporter permease subunit [Georgenia subflava]|uniref:ABC transporter permease subunit n=1 Tax=Georgenia subflava TaxID=1622177 RepID=A0A6N7ENS9_9MICO|nr:ABC transporter permease subunit [Georgenia subflava]MPV36884.1 ABC transporter permease subunit [Georgenia subflava]